MWHEKELVTSCPGFGWDRVNFHKRLVGLTQTSPSNGILYTVWWCAWYLSEGAGWRRGICYSEASWALSGENITRCKFFISILLLGFFFSLCLSVKRFLSQPTSFAFSSGCGEEWESEYAVLYWQLGLNHSSYTHSGGFVLGELIFIVFCFWFPF